MPFQLRTTYIHLFTAIVIFGVYGFWIFGVLGIDYFLGADALVRIGKAISILIVAGYAFEISVTSAVEYFGSSRKKGDKDAYLFDERDSHIFYRSMTHSHFVLCTGIFLSVGTLALGVAPFWVFNIIVLAFLLSVLAELITKLFLYNASIAR